ncbi:hypothetical protein ACOME3_002156 [Neoechinorhynchus agilis]
MEHQHDPSSSAARKFDDDHTDPDCIDDFFHQTTIELVSPRKLIVAIFFLAFSWIFSSYTITLADERSPDPNQYRPLPDIFIDNVTRIPWAATVSEVIIVAFGILFLLLVTFHRYRTLIVVRCCVILSTLYLFRAMTIWVTSMPVVGSHLNCRSVKPNTLTGRIERAAHVLQTCIGPRIIAFPVSRPSTYRLLLLLRKFPVSAPKMSSMQAAEGNITPMKRSLEIYKKKFLVFRL